METSTLLIDILTRNILKPTRSGPLALSFMSPRSWDSTVQVRDLKDMKLWARGPRLLPREVTVSPGDSMVQVRDLGDMKLRARGPFPLPMVVTLSPGDSTVQVRDLRARGPFMLPRDVTVSPGDSTVQVSDLGDMKLRARGPFLLPRMGGGRRSPAVACWASDHWVASSNPLRGKFRH